MVKFINLNKLIKMAEFKIDPLTKVTVENKILSFLGQRIAILHKELNNNKNSVEYTQGAHEEITQMINFLKLQ